MLCCWLLSFKRKCTCIIRTFPFNEPHKLRWKWKKEMVTAVIMLIPPYLLNQSWDAKPFPKHFFHQKPKEKKNVNDYDFRRNEPEKKNQNNPGPVGWLFRVKIIRKLLYLLVVFRIRAVSNGLRESMYNIYITGIVVKLITKTTHFGIDSNLMSVQWQTI